MKLDHSLFQKVQQELSGSEKKYRRKYLTLAIVGTLAWVALWIFLGGKFAFVGTILWASEWVGFIWISLPVWVYTAGITRLSHKAEEIILERIASENNGTYRKTLNLNEEKARMFRHGSNRRARDEISFAGEGKEKVRFLHYSFSLGSGKSQQAYSYKVLGISGLGTFPQMYLNYRKNKFSMSIGQTLSLPSEFEKEFILSIPEGYHLEALQAFTPDILHEILNLAFRCDIEFVDGEMLFLLEGIESLAKDFDKLESQIESARKIASLLKPKLENLRWAPVGDKPHVI